MKEMLTDKDLQEKANCSFAKVVSINVLYKYVAFDDFIDKIIPNSTLKFSRPESFNDPFDCDERFLDIKITEEVAIKYISECSIKLDRKQRRLLVRDLMSGNFLKVFEKRKEKYRICSFSKLNDDILMWSHYANKHQGVCLGFSLPVNNRPYFSIYPVNYEKEIRQIDGEVSVEKVFWYWLTTKSKKWKYEKEFRAISIIEQEFIPFDKTQLKEIIFGCRVKRESINAAIKILKECDYSSELILSKMKIAEKSFSLQAETIKFDNKQIK